MVVWSGMSGIWGAAAGAGAVCAHAALKQAKRNTLRNFMARFGVSPQFIT
jgi:hypothetical protein